MLTSFLIFCLSYSTPNPCVEDAKEKPTVSCGREIDFYGDWDSIGFPNYAESSRRKKWQRCFDNTPGPIELSERIEREVHSCDIGERSPYGGGCETSEYLVKSKCKRFTVGSEPYKICVEEKISQSFGPNGF